MISNIQKKHMTYNHLVTMIAAMLIVPAMGMLQPAQADNAGQEATPAVSVNQPTGSDAPAEPLQTLDAKITKVIGSSVQYSVDEGQTWKNAQKDVVLPKNAMVRTGFASGCEISFRGNTILQVEALSSLKIADYLGNNQEEKVNANLQYGAVRCGVERGRIKSDTKITTPVAVLAIRGTITHVEFDRGTGQCGLGVLRDGPADVITPRGRYALSAGMDTDSQLSRHLMNAIFDRTVFVTGSRSLGELTGVEAYSLSNVLGAVDFPTDDSRLLIKGQEDRLLGSLLRELGGDGHCPDGECDPGPSQ